MTSRPHIGVKGLKIFERLSAPIVNTDHLNQVSKITHEKYLLANYLCTLLFLIREFSIIHALR